MVYIVDTNQKDLLISFRTIRNPPPYSPFKEGSDMKKTMKHWKCFLMGLAVFALFILEGCSSVDSGSRVRVSDFKVKRGTNLSHWFSQTGVRGAARAARVKEDDFIRLKEFGFDHVRIPIDEEQFWDNNGNKLTDAWELLDASIKLALKHELRVIVDLHIIRSFYFNASIEGNNTNTLFTEEKSQEQLVNLWRELSAALKGFSTDWVAYEFLNEPVADDPEQWNDLIAKVHKTLRQLEPERVLVIGSNMWQDVDTFKDLKIPKGDKNILLSFHYYRPMAITHYRASWNPVGKYYGQVHYPGIVIAQADFDKLPEAQKETFQSFTTNWDRSVLREQILQAVTVAKKLGLPLFCGEWGVISSCPREPAYNWYRDMISVFDEFDIGWTTWNYDSGFGFWNPYSKQVSDKPMLEILTSGKGLK